MLEMVIFEIFVRAVRDWIRIFSFIP